MVAHNSAARPAKPFVLLFGRFSGGIWEFGRIGGPTERT
jgi:hypothetical protein